jgi:hypothetical protein
MNNTAFFNTKLPPSINLPPGFTASVFASGLNMPTGMIEGSARSRVIGTVDRALQERGIAQKPD